MRHRPPPPLSNLLSHPPKEGECVIDSASESRSMSDPWGRPHPPTPCRCVIDSAGVEWEQIQRNFEAARRTSSAARSDEWG